MSLLQKMIMQIHQESSSTYLFLTILVLLNSIAEGCLEYSESTCWWNRNERVGWKQKFEFLYFGDWNWLWTNIMH